MDLVHQILNYEKQAGHHRAGSFAPQVFEAIARALPDRIEASLETGTGKSTIFLSNISDCHIVFAIDDRQETNSSVSHVLECPWYRAQNTEFVFGPTQKTLPQYVFPTQIDLAVIDGPHGYPFPDLEYYYIYPLLKREALLVIDDIHIPTIRNLFNVIREDSMFELVSCVRTTAILKRTDAPLFDPLGDGWWLQNYNTKRFQPPERTLPVRVRAATWGITASALRSLGLYAPLRSLYRKVKPR